MSRVESFLATSVALFVLLASAGRAEGEKGTVIVMPSRQTVVQFAFDVARLRSVYLVAYDSGVAGSPVRLHVWDSRAGEWAPISEQSLRSGSVFVMQPRSVVLVGTDRDVTADLANACSFAGEPVRIESLQIVDLLNGITKVLDFRPREWSWLAQRYGLDLDDRNEERRRYGKYGPPRGRMPEEPELVRPEGDIVTPQPVVGTEGAEATNTPPAAPVVPPPKVDEPAVDELELLDRLNGSQAPKAATPTPAAAPEKGVSEAAQDQPGDTPAENK